MNAIPTLFKALGTMQIGRDPATTRKKVTRQMTGTATVCTAEDRKDYDAHIANADRLHNQIAALNDPNAFNREQVAARAQAIADARAGKPITLLPVEHARELRNCESEILRAALHEELSEAGQSAKVVIQRFADLAEDWVTKRTEHEKADAEAAGIAFSASPVLSIAKELLQTAKQNLTRTHFTGDARHLLDFLP